MSGPRTVSPRALSHREWGAKRHVRAISHVAPMSHRARICVLSSRHLGDTSATSGQQARTHPTTQKQGKGGHPVWHQEGASGLPLC